MSEHLDFQNGQFRGLWNINPEYAHGSDMWAKIDDIIQTYTKIHPMEMELQVRANAQRTKTQLNEFGSTQSKSLRLGISIPVGLMLKLQSVYPEVFTEKKLFHKFLQKYKGFRIPEKI